MKKILGILVLGLLWCNVSFAEVKVLEMIQYGENLLKKEGQGTSSVTTILCVDGLKFLSLRFQDSVSVTQMLGTDGKPLTCSMD